MRKNPFIEIVCTLHSSTTMIFIHPLNTQGVIDLLHKIHLLRLFLLWILQHNDFHSSAWKPRNRADFSPPGANIEQDSFFLDFLWETNIHANLSYFLGAGCLNPSLRLTENLSLWQFLRFLAISALSADLALRGAGGGGLLDYRRKFHDPSLPANKVDCSASKNLRKPYIFTQDQRSEIIYWPRLSKHLSRLHQTQGHALQRLKEPCDVANRPFFMNKYKYLEMSCNKWGLNLISIYLRATRGLGVWESLWCQ